jgi:hypothetical protein
MESRFRLLVQSLRKRLGLFVSISFGLFLFILFFQPFALNKFDFNNKLLFIAGFGAIVFAVMLLVSTAFLWIIYKNRQSGNGNIISSYLSGFFILTLCSVAFAFYLRYVGSASISFYIMFKIVLICMTPPVVLKLYDSYEGLIQQNISLISEKKLIQKRIEKYEEDNLNKSVEFISETSGENLTLLISEVVFIQSADNYVEVTFMEGQKLKKALIRNTLKNIELQIKQYSNFIRCHRTFVVNLHYVVKLNHDYNSHWVTIKGYDEKVPVSRQYLLKLKEAL